MPKKIDPEVRARAVRLVNGHLGEYWSLTAASEAVARQVGASKETVRRWALQAEVDAGDRQGATTEELAEIRELKAKVRRAGPLIMGFIAAMRAEGDAVESICQVLREQGCPVAARTYRSWEQPDRRVANRTVTDAMVVDMIRGFAWRPDLKSGEPKLIAEWAG